MADKSSVHVERRESGWAVVREGSGRAISLHQTQAEAAKEGRNIARREKTEFFLHAQDGRIREHNSYGEQPRPAEEEAAVRPAGPLDAVTETVGEVSTGVSATVGTLGEAAREVAGSSTREGEQPERGAARRSGETTSEEPSDTKESHDLGGHQHDDRSLEARYAGYEIYDEDGERIGKLDDLFVDETDNPEYVGVRTGLSETGSILIPADVVTVDDRLRRMVVSRPKSVVEAGPTYGADEEVTPAFEERVRSHYGLASGQGAADKGDYGAYYHRYEEREESGATGSGGDLAQEEDRDELRVRRIEEELKVGTREREAGAVRVRKRVVTDHETIVVPKKRVEVTVEHVPVEGEAISAEEGTAKPEIGEEEEIVVPVVEEEVVVEKRPVVKEEIRIRKEVVEDSEVVEEDVRREEVEVDDEITQRDL